VSLVPDWLAHRAAATPARAAVRLGERRWTFAELDRAVSALAAWLQSEGVRQGSSVGLLAWNSLAAAVAIHAVPRAGGVLVPLNARLTADDLAWQLRDSGASLLLFDDANAALGEAAARTAGVLARRLPDLDALHEAAFPPPRFRLDAPHSIVYTSGTTGRPKGVVLTFANHLWSAVGSAFNLGLIGDDVWLACLPFFHVGGLSILLRGVLYGIEVSIHEGFDAGRVNRDIDEGGATIVSVVATMLRRLLDARCDAPYPPSLRCILVGGGPVPRDLLERCARMGAPVVQTYGLTEAASQVCTLPPEDALRKLGSAGKPIFPTEVRVVDEAGEPCAPGEPGEIWVRGPTVMAGYHRQPEATAEKLRGEWLATGDVGYLDDEGYLYVLDRREDLIVTGGENVAPAEIERVLCEHPAVAGAAAVGLPDPEWGQRVAAAVELRPGAEVSPQELLELCRHRLAGYKLPREIRIVAELPKTASGKVVRRLVREQWLSAP
jgi:O-succinylbenzoic acid--CoA ligase